MPFASGCARIGVWRLAVVLAGAALSLGPGAVEPRAQAAVTLGCDLAPGPARAVAEVLDGETIRLDDGIEVRLVGALAPRAGDAGAAAGDAAWPPEEAARTGLGRLLAGQSVMLAFAGRRSDRYQRVLAQVFLTRDGEDIWVQGRLVEEGLARAYSLPESEACLPQLLERERRARAANRGLWAHAAYQVRPADRPTELARYQGTFQLVRGRVERGRGTRSGLAILELASSERPLVEGPAQRGAFRIAWRRNVAVGAGFERPERLVGRNILVRGWIEVRAGPGIEIGASGQLEAE